MISKNKALVLFFLLTIGAIFSPFNADARTCTTTRGGTEICSEDDGSQTIDGAPTGQQGNPGTGATQPSVAADAFVDTTFQGNYAAPSFIALTSIPGIQEAVASDSLAILLNNLYKLCIGLAAVIAVLKIIQGGVTYMLGDSVTEKKEAKHHIAMAVLGLVFILSPYLVFNVIDPRILKLDVDVSRLKPGPVVPHPTAEDYTDDGEFLGDGVGEAGGGAGQQGTGPAGLNWVYRFASGEYFFVLGSEIRSPEEGINCYSLYGESQRTVEECRTQKAEWYESGDTVFHDCARSDGNDVRVHIDTNLPICEF